MYSPEDRKIFLLLLPLDQFTDRHNKMNSIKFVVYNYYSMYKDIECKITLFMFSKQRVAFPNLVL